VSVLMWEWEWVRPSGVPFNVILCTRRSTMKKLSGIAAGIALAALVSQPLAAAAAPTVADDVAWVNGAFGGVGSATTDIEFLDKATLEQSRGAFAPLAFAVATITIDFALLGFYYGIYIPTVSTSGGTCSGCSDALFSPH
ncbi:MAG: hypothetical protein ACNA7T_15875, partial [Haliea sp.]